MSKRKESVLAEDSPKPKRIALLLDSKGSLLMVQEGIKLLYEAKKDGIINWVTGNICDIRKDPKGFDDILQEYTQSGIDVVVVVSESDYKEIIISNLRHKYNSRTTNVVSVTTEQSILNSTQIFQDIISGNLPEMKCAEFERGRRLAPYEIMKLLPSKT